MRTKLFRKLAAVGVSALTLASSVAMAAQSVPTELTRDFFFSSTGTNANFVVGSIAHPLDAIVAANIGAAIASNAYTTETVTVGGGEGSSDATVTITVGATSTTRTDGRDFDVAFDLGADEFAAESASYQDAPSILHRVIDSEFEETDGDSYDITVEETLDFTANIDYQADEDVHGDGAEGFFANIGGAGITYTIDFGAGIRDFDNRDADEANDGDGTIWFLGKEYRVLRSDEADLELDLATLEAAQQVFTGTPEMVTVDGTDYMLELSNVFLEDADGEYRGTFKLWNADGTTQVGTTESDVTDGDTIDFGNAVPEMFVESLGVQTAGPNAGKGQATIQTTGMLIELADGDDLHDSIDSVEEDAWDVAITTDGVDIDSLTITNNDLTWDNENLSDEDQVLFPGDVATLPTGVGVLEFKGFETEDMTDVMIGGNEVDGYPTIFFHDQDNSDSATSLQLYSRGGVRVNGIMFDVIDVVGDAEVYVALPGDDVDDDALVDFDPEDDITTAGAVFTLGGDVEVLDGTTVYNGAGDTFDDRGWDVVASYGLWLEAGQTSDNDLYFLLQSGAWTTEHGYTLTFFGTDLDELTTPFDADADDVGTLTDLPAAGEVTEDAGLGATGVQGAGFYFPVTSDTIDNWNAAGLANADIENRDGQFAAGFLIEGDFVGDNDHDGTGDGAFLVWVDTHSGQLVDLKTDSTTQSFDALSGYNEEIGYDDAGFETAVDFAGTGGGELAYSLQRDDADEDDDVQIGYTETGIRAELMNSSEYADFDLPKANRDVVMFFGGSAITTTGGTTVTLGAGETSDGVTVTSIGGGAGSSTVEQTTPLAFNMRTYLDNQAPAGNLIVIGSGHVNSLTKAVETTMGYNTAAASNVAGNWTIDLSGNRLYVFGYTKEDTQTAGNALISWINANL